MSDFSGISDEHYFNMNLNTELELPSNRETLLHYFEQLKRRYPTMRNFYSRERGDYVLEEDKDAGNYRWASIETKRISSGYVNPPDVDSAMEQHCAVLEMIPYTLSMGPLDCESLNYMMGFDFSYRGNHHELVSEALGLSPAFERLSEAANSKIVSNEMAVQIALDSDCRTQCRLSIEPRTSAYQIRTGDFGEDHLSVYITIRRYGSLDHGSFVDQLVELKKHADQLMESYIVDNVLLPLKKAIAIK